jgi:uncharacterized protein YjbI with pentapeptide repeats
MAKPPSSKAKSQMPAIAAEPAPDPAAEPPVAFDVEGLKRVQDIIKNARATWFALLGALVFASITLASVKDVSFFVNTVETKLPLVGISVPVTSFFWAGSLLIAAIYAYFHLYLELLWQALGDAPARIDGKPLADRIDPWIVADSALRLRDRLRGAHGEERASRKRAMQVVSDFVSVWLVWMFGLVVIGWFWWRSMPKHDPLLTGFLGLELAAVSWVFCTGIVSATTHLSDTRPNWHWKLTFAIAVALIAGLTIMRTGEDPLVGLPRWAARPNHEDLPKDLNWLFEPMRPAIAHLEEATLSERSNDWPNWETTWAESKLQWCKERGVQKCQSSPWFEGPAFESKDDENDFLLAWEMRWGTAVGQLTIPDLSRVDLRGANLRHAKLEGIDLSDAELSGAILVRAMLDGANLNGANLEGAVLNGAKLRNTSLSSSLLRGAELMGASLRSADLSLATLNNANLSGAGLQSAHLDGASLDSAKLYGVNMNRASLVSSSLQSIQVSGTTFDGANLTAAKLSGTSEYPLDFTGSSMKSAIFRGTAFRNAVFSSSNIQAASDFDLSFADASVILPIGQKRPCQWAKVVLDDPEYFGRWLGWLEALGDVSELNDLSDYPAIPFTDSCFVPAQLPE